MMSYIARTLVVVTMTFFCVNYHTILPVGCSSIKDSYYGLYNDLVGETNYKKEVRPATSANDPLIVSMDFHLLSIADVDEKGQMLVVSARLFLRWDDDYLSWDEASYANISSFQAPQEKVYLPDVVLANSVTKQKQLGFDELPVRIKSDGVVQWEPTERLSTDCDIDIQFFPFESQLCKIEFETALSTTEEIDVDVETGKSAINLGDFGENSQWELVGTKAETLANEGGKSKIRFSLLMKRRRTFYLLNIILPVFFLSLTASLVFALPADEGEKMGTSITVLLAFAVYLSIVADIIPNTSLQVSILALYLTILLALSSFSTILSVVVLRLHHRDQEWPIGETTESVFKFLAKVVCPGPQKKNREQGSDSRPSSGKNNNNDNGNRHRVSPELPPLSSIKQKTTRDPEVEDNNRTPEEPMTWQMIAHTLDYIFFILFTLATIIITLVCLLYLHFGAIANAPTL